MFPWLDLRLAGFPVAIIVKPGGEVDFHRIKVLHGGYFVCRFNKTSGGIFKLDNKYRLRGRKAAIFIYDASQGKPLSITALKEINHFAKKNNLHKVTRNDVKFGGKLRQRLGMVKDKSEAMRLVSEESNAEKADMDSALSKTNEANPYQILQDLRNTGHIDDDTALNISTKLETGQLNFEQFLNELNQLTEFSIHEPISASTQLFLDDFHNFSPSEVYQTVLISRKAGKEFEKMSSQPVNNSQLAKIIIPAGLIMIVGFYILSQMDFSNLGGIADMLPSPPSWITPRE